MVHFSTGSYWYIYQSVIQCCIWEEFKNICSVAQSSLGWWFKTGFVSQALCVGYLHFSVFEIISSLNTYSLLGHSRVTKLNYHTIMCTCYKQSFCLSHTCTCTSVYCYMYASVRMIVELRNLVKNNIGVDVCIYKTLYVLC